MATRTSFLRLILPALGEFFDRWNEPMNANFQVIDENIEALSTEIESARGTTGSLSDRLAALNPDGSLGPVPEVVTARSSKVYGSASGGADFDLDARLEEGDLEVWTARGGLDALRDSLAWAQDDVKHNSLVSGPSNPLTFSGAVVTLNGLVTPIVANINGYRQVVRTNKTSTIVGASGTYYLYLDRSAGGESILSVPASSGQTSLYTPTSKIQKFSSPTVNFVTSGVKPGDILNITGPLANPNVGRYVVLATNVEDGANLSTNELRIVGEFPSAVTGLDGEIINPISPTFSFTGTPHSKTFARLSNRIYVGRCVFDGSNVVSITPYAYNASYEAWQTVTPSAGDFSLSVPHNLGYIPKNIRLYASTANDFSQPLEPLGIGKMTAGSATLTAGDQTLNYTAPVLRRDVVVRVTDTTIEIKNATNGIYYEDYSGTPQTSGFMFVVIER